MMNCRRPSSTLLPRHQMSRPACGHEVRTGSDPLALQRCLALLAKIQGRSGHASGPEHADRD